MTSLRNTNDNADSEENVIPVEQEPNLNIEIDDEESDDDDDIDPELDLYSETDRLKTFDGWPNEFVTPQDLAADGFYYTKHDDKTRCAYCKVKIGQWVENDVPDIEHRRFSTPVKCKFLLWCKSATRDNCAIFQNAGSKYCYQS